jgi:hypothetical protein
MLRTARSFRAVSTCAVLAAASVLALTACSPGEAAPSESPSPSATATTEPTTTPTETAPPEETATPFAIDCDALLTIDQLYAFNPNFSVDPGYAPGGGAVAEVVAQGGTACGYINQSSGEVIAIAVATPTAAALEERGNAAASTSTAVPTYGTPPDAEGYFTQAGGQGQAQVFAGPYWIVLESPVLFEPGDAQQLVADVRGNLPA